ncbi:helix-turn-helix transcriptional regulator [Chelatococcus asaccharovorans]|uniref:HTH domain-containing protein n=1 Tax=Chelatococcus asaccharovorans TaxID=28210 RepID=A0A2V3U3M8_9HYPH|nr:YafY family protein [Chelatococcus asaccharovorans]MBS7703035.1 YafY family transcriptional regulator [Chelatococcus asaccharovorans]PXW57334.1 HTH domain-containing protein [Chelatococcus asaccharovorans]CAH1673785.1 HTH domain-containing protein [Chelatococcus asaccharovorans]CAH1674811.1 HTH domain-containing protein [Chelatococcus asaccharovorans]
MRRTDRLFELLQLFREGRFWRGRDLAERLETSLRTVYRDIDTLVASGIPIEGERGVGYILREPIFLPPLTLSSAELEALHLGVELVSRMGDPALSEAAARLKVKIDAVAPTSQRGADHAGAVSLFTPAPTGPQRFLPILRDAVKARALLAMTYRRRDGMLSDRTVRPLHLEFWGRVWTLTAWCEARSDFRVFRADRIEAVSSGRGTFPVEAGKTYQDYLAQLRAREGTA